MHYFACIRQSSTQSSHSMRGSTRIRWRRVSDRLLVQGTMCSQANAMHSRPRLSPAEMGRSPTLCVLESAEKRTANSQAHQCSSTREPPAGSMYGVEGEILHMTRQRDLQAQTNMVIGTSCGGSFGYLMKKPAGVNASLAKLLNQRHVLSLVTTLTSFMRCS